MKKSFIRVSKCLVALLLVMVLIVGVMPTTAFAATKVNSATNFDKVYAYIEANGKTTSQGKEIMVNDIRDDVTFRYAMATRVDGSIYFWLNGMIVGSTSALDMTLSFQLYKDKKDITVHYNRVFFSFPIEKVDGEVTIDRSGYTLENTYTLGLGKTDTDLFNTALPTLIAYWNNYLYKNIGIAFSQLGFIAMGDVVAPVCDTPSGYHTGKTEIVGEVKPTATQTGYTGDTHCAGCGVKLRSGVTIPVDLSATLGDVDGNGTVDSTDARLVLQYAVGKIGKDAINIAVANVDGINKIDSTDARLILQYAVGKIQAFPNAG